MLRRKHRYVSSDAAWRHLGCLAINLLGLRAEVRSVALMSRGSRHHLRSISSGAHATTLARHVTSPIGIMTVMGPLAHDTRDAGAVRAMLSATRTSIASRRLERACLSSRDILQLLVPLLAFVATRVRHLPQRQYVSCGLL